MSGSVGKIVVRWIFVLWLVGLNLVLMGASPIVGYVPESTQAVPHRFYSASLKHMATQDVMPLLRTLCSTCDWMVDHLYQRVGVVTSRKNWIHFLVKQRLNKRIIHQIANGFIASGIRQNRRMRHRIKGTFRSNHRY